MFDVLGFVPGNITIYKLAFSHKSSQNEKSVLSQNNERLEYLGDAVLGTIVAEYLFKKYPDSNEGFLTKMRSKIVKRKTLNRIGDKMELDGVLQEFNNTRLSRSMLGNAVEALVGAIYLDAGYAFTQKYIVENILRRYLDIHELENYDDNYKSQLLEWCQKHGKTISYKLISRYKYEKRDRFKVGVFVNNQRIATADDFNKKSAEQAASEKAMIELGFLTEEDDD
ncbi:MAG: ribonuclease III [Saprospiraceae bacterium]|jgi:ribonuclease-3